MHSRAAYIIRHASPSDAPALTALAMHSKAHWGYPQEWLTLWKDDLTITPDIIANAMAYVAEEDEKVIGFWVRSRINSEHPSSGWLFVHPAHMGRGIARALWQAIRTDARASGIDSFTIEADPHAEAFYLSLGAVRIGEKESTLIPGRYFPLLRLTV